MSQTVAPGASSKAEDEMQSSYLSNISCSHITSCSVPSNFSTCIPLTCCRLMRISSPVGILTPSIPRNSHLRCPNFLCTVVPHFFWYFLQGTNKSSGRANASSYRELVTRRIFFRLTRFPFCLATSSYVLLRS